MLSPNEAEIVREIARDGVEEAERALRRTRPGSEVAAYHAGRLATLSALARRLGGS